MIPETCQNGNLKHLLLKGCTLGHDSMSYDSTKQEKINQVLNARKCIKNVGVQGMLTKGTIKLHNAMLLKRFKTC